MWRKVIKEKYGNSFLSWCFKMMNVKTISIVRRGIVENAKDERVAKWIGKDSFSGIWGMAKQYYFGKTYGAE